MQQSILSLIRSLLCYFGLRIKRVSLDFERNDTTPYPACSKDIHRLKTPLGSTQTTSLAHSSGFKIESVGNVFSAYQCANGADWYKFATQTVAISANYDVELAASAGSSSETLERGQIRLCHCYQLFGNRFCHFRKTFCNGFR
jgi:hypothetical protein